MVEPEEEEPNPQVQARRVLSKARTRRALAVPVPRDETVEESDRQRIEVIKSTAIEMMMLSRSRCRELTSEGKFDEAAYESEECGSWWDRATGRGSE